MTSRRKLAADIRTLVNVNGVTTVTMELPADSALVLAHELERSVLAPVRLEARLRGRIDPPGPTGRDLRRSEA